MTVLVERGVMHDGAAMATLSELLHRARMRRGHSMRDAARAIGVSHPAWQGWENGAHRPGDAQLPGLALYLGMDVDDVVALRDGADLDLPDGGELSEQEVTALVDRLTRQIRAEIAEIRRENAQLRAEVARHNSVLLELLNDMRRRPQR